MKRKILIVDDQPGILLLLKEVLKQDGYHILTAETGPKAIELARIHHFHLIILDYRLPIKNGYEVIQQLEIENISTPVIIMTGLPEQVTETMKESSLVVCVLAKPFNVTDFQELVREKLTKYR